MLVQVDSEQPLVAAPVTFGGTGGGVDVRVRHPQQLVLYSVCLALRCSGDWRGVFHSSSFQTCNPYIPWKTCLAVV